MRQDDGRFISGMHDVLTSRSYRARRQGRVSYDVLSRGGTSRRTAARVRARLAGTRDQLAPPVAGVRRARLPRGRARHARLRPFVGVSHARRIRVAEHRRRHDRLDRFVGARARGVGRSRLGQPGGLEHREPPSGALRGRRESVRAVLHARARPRAVSRTDQSRHLSGRSVPGRAVGVSAALSGGFRRRDAGDGCESVHPREAAVPQRRPERVRFAVRYCDGATQRRLVRAPTCRRYRATTTWSPRPTSAPMPAH